MDSHTIHGFLKRLGYITGDGSKEKIKRELVKFYFTGLTDY
jgi:hypothetical protein